MNLLNRLGLRWNQMTARIWEVVGIFSLFVIAFTSGRMPPLGEGVVGPMFSLFEGHEEMFAYRLGLAKFVAKWEAFLGLLAFGLTTVYFLAARKTFRAFWERREHGRDIPESAANHPSPGKWMEGAVVWLGLVGLALAFVVAILSGVIVLLDWRGALESIPGRAQTMILSGIAAKTALASGICSLVFWIATEWANRRNTNQP